MFSYGFSNDINQPGPRRKILQQWYETHQWISLVDFPCIPFQETIPKKKPIFQPESFVDYLSFGWYNQPEISDSQTCFPRMPGLWTAIKPIITAFAPITLLCDPGITTERMVSNYMKLSKHCDMICYIHSVVISNRGRESETERERSLRESQTKNH